MKSLVTFFFLDGSWSSALFASATVAKEWILTRRSWDKPISTQTVPGVTKFDYE